MTQGIGSDKINFGNIRDSRKFASYFEKSDRIIKFMSSQNETLVDDRNSSHSVSDNSSPQVKQNGNQFQKYQNMKHQKKKKDRFQPRSIKEFNEISNQNANKFSNPLLIQEEINQKSSKKQKTTKSLIKHFFKYHLFSEKIRHFKTHLVRIYFTMKVLKNNMLGQFLLFNLIQNTRGSSLIEKNQILLHQKYFESRLNEKNFQSSVISSINLQNMLELNKLVSRFENKLQSISVNIQKFWRFLFQEKQSFEIYQRGLKISQSLNNLSDLYELIQEKQGENKEVKVYILMSGFYKYVVFKSQESMQELQKSKQVYQTKKFDKLGSFNDRNGEKGLIIANLSLKKPMDIDFINKACSKIILYKQSEVRNIKINKLMPQIIAESHHKFLEKFMITGKAGMLNQRREIFIKRKNGYILPVISYLCINQHNPSSLILIIEKNEAFNYFEDDNEQDTLNLTNQKGKQAFLIADSELRVCEMTEDVCYISKISQKVISILKNSMGVNPQLDDLFQLTQFQNTDIISLMRSDKSEFDAVLKPEVEQILQEDILNQSELQIQQQNSKSLINGLSGKNIFQQMMTLTENTNHYHLRIVTEELLGGTLKYNIIGIRQIIDTIEEEKYPSILKGTNERKIEKSQAIQQKDSLMKSQEMIDEEMDNYDMSSQTSTTSSSSTAIQQFTQYNSHVKSQRLPITLKFILQIMILVFVIILATSTVTLILTLSNTNDTQNAINICSMQINRLNRITQIRLVFRLIFNIALGYVSASTDVAPQRFNFYGQYLLQLTEELRGYQVQLAQYDNQIQDIIGQVQLQYLLGDNSVYYEERDLNQAINLFIDTSDDLIQLGLEFGPSYFYSQESFFVFANVDNGKATITERNGFFIISNGNQDLYFKLYNSANEYNAIKKESINSKVQFSNIMSWVCIAIICVCGLTVIPLFARIQSRILVLMKVFFDIDKSLIKLMQEKFTKFDNMIMPPPISPILLNSTDQPSQHQKQTISNSVKVNQQDASLLKKIEKNSIKNNKNNKIAEKYNSNKSSQKNDNGQFQSEEIDEEEIKVEIDEEIYEDDEMSDEIQKKQKKNHQKKNKSKKKKKEIEVEVQGQFQSKNNSSALLSYFTTSVNRLKIKQSILIFILTAGFVSYFLGIYFLSKQVFTDAADSTDIVKIIQLRKSCVENVIHATTEALLFNTTYLINDGTAEIQSFYNQLCSTVETDFLYRVKRDQPAYLNEAMFYLDMLEDGDFCQYSFSDGDDGFLQNGTQINVQECLVFDNGISQQGITQLYQQIYSLTRQIQLDYATQFALNGAQNITFMIDLINRPTLILDAEQILLKKPSNIQTNLLIQSIYDYFQKQALYFIMIYLAFIIVTIVLMAIFLLNIFRRLRREMILSNRLLYIIDFESINEVQKNTITTFLTNY